MPSELGTKSLSSSHPRIQPMAVDNLGFLLDRLGQDCHDLQFLRELTQNSLEACARSMKAGGDAGQILWDVDWTIFELEGLYKLSVTDNGDGMTGSDMVQYINQLSASKSQQSMSGNFGVGAKIAAATRNREGVVYLSWQNREGAMIQLYRDSEADTYGLKQWSWADGSFNYFKPISDEIKPELIGSHGTKVVLLGNNIEQDTMKCPLEIGPQARWIAKYLNTRYFSFPDGVTVKAREGWEYPRNDSKRNKLRTITGMAKYLAENSSTSGVFELTGFRAHWWILKDSEALSDNLAYYESIGHVAALYKNELYEMTAGRAKNAMLQQFGVTFGQRFVVIYLEPCDSGVTTNTARTQILINGSALPWAEWAAEFRENMPEALRTFIDEKSRKSEDTDHTNSIRDRLKDILDLYKVSRYRPTPVGRILVDPDQMSGLTDKAVTSTTSSSKESSNRSRGKESFLGNVYSIFEKKDGTPGTLVKPDVFPEVRWISVEQETREPGQLEDRAAQYIPEQNLLLINGDFRVFCDLRTHFEKMFGNTPGAREVILSSVHAWFEQALVETILGLTALRGSKEWTMTDIQSALSPEALSAAVMQRYHVVFAVKRELGAKFGAFDKRATGRAANS